MSALDLPELVYHDHAAIWNFLDYFVLEIFPEFLQLLLIIDLKLRFNVLLGFIWIYKVHVVLRHAHWVGFLAKEVLGDAWNAVEKLKLCKDTSVLTSSLNSRLNHLFHVGFKHLTHVPLRSFRLFFFLLLLILLLLFFFFILTFFLLLLIFSFLLFHLCLHGFPLLLLLPPGLHLEHQLVLCFSLVDHLREY